MCANIQRRGSGCTSIGVTAPQTTSSLIPFTRTFFVRSTRFSNETKRHRTLHRQLSHQSSPMVDKVPPSFSSMQRMRHVSRLILLAAGGSILVLTGCGTGRGGPGKPYHFSGFPPAGPSPVRGEGSLSDQYI